MPNQTSIPCFIVTLNYSTVKMQQEFIIVVSCKKKKLFIYLAFIFSLIYTSILYFSNHFTSVKVGK